MTRALAGIALVFAAGALDAEEPLRRNGFALEPADVAVEEILPGGPPRDGIPALDHPPTADARHPWPDDELVIGVTSNGVSRAYPVSLLFWHELVNDDLGGRPILVSYCPLCGTGIVFDRRLPGGFERHFGVSGLLYRSNLLMYDRESQSLWSQISARAITGRSRGKRLRVVRSRMARWGEWREAHPATSVLTRQTGHRRDYGRDPYGDYARSDALRFPVELDRRHPPKTRTVGLRVADGTARAYPADVVAAAGGAIAERFAGHPVRVAWDAERGRFRVEAPDAVEVVEGYWFAWAAFHPHTSVAGPAGD